MDQATLSTIEVKDGMNNLLSFTSSYNSSNDILTLSPATFWASDSEITITVFNTSSDEDGNPLDGNLNGIPDGDDDHFSWSFFSGLGVDDVGPTINDLNTTAEIFRGTPLSITGLASDQSTIAVTNVAYIEYSIDLPLIQGQGISIDPTDNSFDEVEEDFSIILNTENLTFGDHTVYFQAKDILGNWGAVQSIDFNIIEENPANWSHSAFNTLNTSSNNASTFTYPVSVKYEKDYSVGTSDFPISRAVVVEDYLVFGVVPPFLTQPNELHCVNLQTGNPIWEHTFDISDELSSPAYAYGNIYVQLGDHSDSKLACYDLLTGNLKWETPYSVQWSDLTGPIVAGGTVYILEGYYDSTIGAYDAFSGELLWTYEVNSSGNYDNWNPAYYQNTVYGYAESFAALDPTTGSAIYSFDGNDIPFNWPGWSMNASPVIDSANHQIILTSQSFIHGFDLTTQEINWSLNSTDYGTFKATPALFEGKLYVPTNQQLMSVDVVTGIVEWQNFDHTGFSQPVVNPQIVAFSTSNATVIFDIQTMEIQSILTNQIGQLALSEEYLIVSHDDNSKLTVYEYNPNQVPLTLSIIQVDSISCFNGNDGKIKAEPSGGSGNLSYEWSVFQPNPTDILGNLSSGTYTVTVNDASGNAISANITLTEPEPITANITSTPDEEMNGNGSALIEPMGGNPPYSFEWADFPGVDVNQLNNLDGGNYIVTITDNNECEKVVTAIVETITNIFDPTLNEYFKIYPNPTSDILNIQSISASNNNGNVKITTSDGRQIQLHNNVNLTDFSISFINEAKGMYFIFIETDDGRAIFKVSVN